MFAKQTLHVPAGTLHDGCAVASCKTKSCASFILIFRGVAQLVARLLWEQDAGCSSHLTPTIKVNIRWYKEVISLRGDFFVCKSRKSFIYKGFRLFLFLWSVLCCPWKPSRNCLLLCTGFQRLLFWNLLLPWGFHSEYKVLHGFKTLFLKDGTQNQFKKTHSRGAVRLAVNLS